MSRYEIFQAPAVEVPSIRRWVVLGLAVSLVFHAALLYAFYRKELSGFSLEDEPVSAPLRPFTMRRVAIPEAPQPEEQRLSMPSEKAPVNPKSLALPSERPQVSDEVVLKPGIVELPKQVFAEKPRVDMAGLDQAMKSAASSRSTSEQELNSIAQSLVQESPSSPRQPIMAVGRGTPGAGAGDSNANIPGVASVDEMLSKAGALRTGDRAAMSGGALFEYDQYELRTEAQDALSKIGTLIQQNPKASFAIEGHTDSFGSPEYNQKLSQKRAESVKEWLVQVFGIAPNRIQTVGYGNSKPLVPATQSKEEQAPNRRVEIVVKMNRRT